MEPNKRDMQDAITNATESAGLITGDFGVGVVPDQGQHFVNYEVLPFSALFEIAGMYLDGFELHMSREERDRLDGLRDILAAIRRKTDTTEKESE